MKSNNEFFAKEWIYAIGIVIVILLVYFLFLKDYYIKNNINFSELYNTVNSLFDKAFVHLGPKPEISYKIKDEELLRIWQMIKHYAINCYLTRSMKGLSVELMKEEVHILQEIKTRTLYLERLLEKNFFKRELKFMYTQLSKELDIAINS